MGTLDVCWKNNLRLKAAGRLSTATAKPAAQFFVYQNPTCLSEQTPNLGSKDLRKNLCTTQDSRLMVLISPWLDVNAGTFGLAGFSQSRSGWSKKSAVSTFDNFRK
jgi:hypothetical protein